jgi:glycosyltransferase involved in cell wall biosynthesis
VLSVPTTYREPKGLYVLEALAAGVPVVQPAHGAFPELLAATGGGRLVAPEKSGELAETLAELLRNRDERVTLSRMGRAAVHSIRTADAMAQATLAEYRRAVGHVSNVPVAAKSSAGT